MPQIFRVDINAQNCWKCQHWRRDNLSQTPNEGTCTADAPRARDAVSDTSDQDDLRAHIKYPSATYCGSFVPWDGATRELAPVIE
jgi:hypothetical protein